MTVLAVLGGGTPFAIDLLDGLATLGPWELRLFGRDRVSLDAIACYARHRLHPDGSIVLATDDIAAALDGADIVVHQIRYGGFAGRDDDERLACRLGVAADETLGPSGLQAAIRMAPPLLAMARDIARWCPQAWIVNLTNPLSCSTAILAQAGLGAVVGLCELPDATQRMACAAIGVDPHDAEWEYIGLNHRGFIHALSFEGTDLIAALVDRLGDRTVGGITAREIATLHAIPLKYFRHCLDRAVVRAAGRAKLLTALREQALAELRRHPTRRPPSLQGRAMPWYAEAVLPFLQTLRCGGPGVHVVNTMGTDGMVREQRARIVDGRVCAAPPRPATPELTRWLRAFDVHERALLAAALDPTPAHVRAALAVDPMLPEARVDAAAEAILGATVE